MTIKRILFGGFLGAVIYVAIAYPLEKFLGASPWAARIAGWACCALAGIILGTYWASKE